MLLSALLWVRNKKEVSHFSVVYEGKIWGVGSLEISLQPYVSCYCTS